MTREQFLTLEVLFHELRVLEPPRRAEALESVRPDLAPMLRELLESADQERALAAQETAPRRFGSWQTVSLLGRGGMGEVWLARRADGAFEGQAAVKLLAAPLRLGGPFVARFQRERQILASLHHPNIARLLDGGVSPEGIPFLVMEYIEGTPIDQYCGERQLPLASRVRLLEQVCQAVGYAHARLILHRDLKPSNILVTPEGFAKLLDFGTATLLWDDAENELGFAGARLLTPAYASPELHSNRPLQLSSDVWSLGVVLFRLVTGNLPFTPETLRSGQSAPPGAPLAGAGRDLDAILARALHPDPDRRYRDAEDLRADLERWRTGRPVAARGGSLFYRAGKLVARNRTTVLLLSLSLFAGAAATAHQASLAARRYASVRQLAAAMVSEVFAQIQRTPASREAQQLVASRLISALAPLRATASGDAAVERLLAQSWLQLARLQGDPYRNNLGDPQAAQASLDTAAGLLATGAHQRNAESLLIRAQIAETRSGVLFGLNQRDRARTEAEAAYQIATSLPGTLPAAILRMDLAGFLGDLAGGSPDRESAERWYRRALEHYAEARRLGGTLQDAAPLVLYIKRGTLWLETDPQQALALFEEGLGRYQQLSGTSREANQRVYQNLVRKRANALAAAGRLAEAVKESDASVSLARRLLSPDPRDQRALFDLIVSLNDQALVLETAGDLPRARAATTETIRLLEPLARQSGPGSSFAANLAEVRQRAARLAATAATR